MGQEGQASPSRAPRQVGIQSRRQLLGFPDSAFWCSGKYCSKELRCSRPPGQRSSSQRSMWNSLPSARPGPGLSARHRSLWTLGLWP